MSIMRRHPDRARLDFDHYDDYRGHVLRRPPRQAALEVRVGLDLAPPFVVEAGLKIGQQSAWSRRRDSRLTAVADEAIQRSKEVILQSDEAVPKRIAPIFSQPIKAGHDHVDRVSKPHLQWILQQLCRCGADNAEIAFHGESR